MSSPLIIAHRGASQVAPENTLAAFRLAWEENADAVETDLRATKDGVIVAFHDPDLRRITGRRGLVCELSFAELQKIDVGSWKDPEWAGERAPSLSQVIETAPVDGQLILELKEDVSVLLERELPAEIADRTTLIAFDPDTIAEAKRRLPACQALWLFGDYSTVPFRGKRLGDWLVQKSRALGIDGVDLRYGRFLNEDLLTVLQSSELTVFTYTVNNSRGITRCARLGLDGITTNQPDDARRWLGIST